MPIPPLYYVIGAVVIGGLVKWKMNQRQQAQEVNTSTTPYIPVQEETAPEPQTIVKTTQPDTETATPTPAKFTTINGIGATYAKRLQAAGIITFADLAQLDAEAVQNIVSPKQPGRAKNAQAWIDEAQKLAESDQ